MAEKDKDDPSVMWGKMGVYYCNFCNLKTTDLGFFQAHNCRCAGVSYNLATSLFTCSICRVMLTEGPFSEHLESHISHKPYACCYCKDMFKTREDVYMHLKNKHSDQKSSSAEDSCRLRISEKTKGLIISAKNKGNEFYKPISFSTVPTPFGPTAQSVEATPLGSMPGFRTILPKKSTTTNASSSESQTSQPTPSVSKGTSSISSSKQFQPHVKVSKSTTHGMSDARKSASKPPVNSVPNTPVTATPAVSFNRFQPPAVIVSQSTTRHGISSHSTSTSNARKSAGNPPVNSVLNTPVTTTPAVCFDRFQPPPVIVSQSTTLHGIASHSMSSANPPVNLLPNATISTTQSMPGFQKIIPVATNHAMPLGSETIRTTSSVPHVLSKSTNSNHIRWTPMTRPQPTIHQSITPHNMPDTGNSTVNQYAGFLLSMPNMPIISPSLVFTPQQQFLGVPLHYHAAGLNNQNKELNAHPNYVGHTNQHFTQSRGTIQSQGNISRIVTNKPAAKATRKVIQGQNNLVNIRCGSHNLATDIPQLIEPAQELPEPMLDMPILVPQPADGVTSATQTLPRTTLTMTTPTFTVQVSPANTSMSSNPGLNIKKELVKDRLDSVSAMPTPFEKKKEVSIKTYLAVIRGLFICLKCKRKWVKAQDFVRHIWDSHLHTDQNSYSCCSQGFSLTCKELQTVLKEVHANAIDAELGKKLHHFILCDKEEIMEESVHVEQIRPVRDEECRVPLQESVNERLETDSYSDRINYPVPSSRKEDHISKENNCSNISFELSQEKEQLRDKENRQHSKSKEYMQTQPGVIANNASRTNETTFFSRSSCSQLKNVCTVDESLASEDCSGHTVHLEPSGEKDKINEESKRKSVESPQNALSNNTCLPVSEETSSSSDSDTQGSPSKESGKSGDETVCASMLSLHRTSSFYQCGFPTCIFSSHMPVDLLLHMNNHSNEKTIPCVYCGKANLTPSGLFEHMHTHIGQDGVKPKYSLSLVCDSKELCIVENRNIKKVIEGLEKAVIKKMPQAGAEVSFRCRLCSSDFEAIDTLVQHLRKSLLKVVSCKYCRSHFLDSNSWQKHMAECHPGKAKQYSINEKLLCSDRELNKTSYDALLLQRCEYRRQALRKENASEVMKKKETTQAANSVTRACSDAENGDTGDCAEDVINTSAVIKVHTQEISASHTDLSADALALNRALPTFYDSGKSNCVQDEMDPPECTDTDPLVKEVDKSSLNCTSSLNNDRDQSSCDKNLVTPKDVEPKYLGITNDNTKRCDNNLNSPKDVVEPKYPDITNDNTKHCDNNLDSPKDVVEPRYPDITNDSTGSIHRCGEADSTSAQQFQDSFVANSINCSPILDVHSDKCDYPVSRNSQESDNASDSQATPMQFKCTVCSKKFYSYFAAQRHRRLHTPGHAKIVRIPSFDVEPDKVYKCKHCSFTCSGDITAMNNHLNAHKYFKCAYCDITYAFSSFMRNHLKYHHAGRPKDMITQNPTLASIFKVQDDRNSMYTEDQELSSNDSDMETGNDGNNDDDLGDSHSMDCESASEPSAKSATPKPRKNAFIRDLLSTDASCPEEISIGSHLLETNTVPSERNCYKYQSAWKNVIKKLKTGCESKIKSVDKVKKVKTNKTEQNVENFPYQCTVCEMNRKCIKDVVDHMRWLHASKQEGLQILDRRSGITFTREGLLVGQSREMDPVHPHLCTLCNYRSSNRLDVKSHVATNHISTDSEKCIVSLHLESPPVLTFEERPTETPLSEITAANKEGKVSGFVSNGSEPTKDATKAFKEQKESPNSAHFQEEKADKQGHHSETLPVVNQTSLVQDQSSVDTTSSSNDCPSSHTEVSAVVGQSGAGNDKVPENHSITSSTSNPSVRVIGTSNPNTSSSGEAPRVKSPANAESSSCSEAPAVSAPTPQPSLQTKYCCHLCPEVSFNEFYFKLHLARHKGFRCKYLLASGIGLPLCTVCGFIASSTAGLADHTATHFTERRYACSVCDCDSHNKGGMKVHLRRFHADDPRAYLIDRQSARSAVDFRPKAVDLDPSLLIRDIFMQHPKLLKKMLVRVGVRKLDVSSELCDKMLNLNKDRYFTVKSSDGQLLAP